MPVEEWDRLVDHLRRFAGDGDVSADAERIAVEAGAARFAVTREGAVDAGMPLHSFSKGSVAALSFDHDRGRIRVEDDGGDLVYEFRRP